MLNLAPSLSPCVWQDNFTATLETTSAQLKSIQVFAAGAPIILAGTRRDEVKGGEAELTKLSDELIRALEQQCAPAIAGLERDPTSGRCFFAIENSKGYRGDATIRELVKAIESAAHKLPSMEQRVPLEWLRVHDELRKIGKVQRRVHLEAVRAVASKHGLPHGGFTLEEELPAMLSFFHSLNAVLWYDQPGLRDLVVLDPQARASAATAPRPPAPARPNPPGTTPRPLTRDVGWPPPRVRACPAIGSG